MEPQEPTFQRVGRYELIRKIATGGMAELFLARFTGPGGFEKRCAVKRILPQFAEDAEFTRMFLNEARVASMFDHPNIAQIFDLGTDENTGQLFIAMELINGMDLRQLLRLAREQGRDIPPELGAYLMSQALDGLAYAHEFRDPDGKPLRVVHRDVSPQNILVSFDGALKLVDFGIVKVNSAEGHTQSGMIKGKVAYMAPEQAAGEAVDGRSDVFAIGVCLYELITGVKPFRGTTEVMTLNAILEQEPQPVTALMPECPEGIEQAVYKALCKDPRSRYQSAREFQVDLLTVLRHCPVPLDRHVVSLFVRSLTEADTTAFESTNLKIPRGISSRPTDSARFAGSGIAPPIGGVSDDAWRAEAALAFKSALEPSKKRSLPPSVFTPVDEAAMAPAVLQNTDSGIFAKAALEVKSDTNVARLAGLGGDRAAWLWGGVAVAALFAAIAYVALEPEPVEIVATASTPSDPPDSPPPRPTPTASPSAATPSASATPVASAPPRPSPTADAPRGKDRRPPKGRGREVDVPPASAGRLTLATQPRGLTVKLGDKVLGTTPLEGVALPPGKHTLALVSTKLGIARHMAVEIKRDEVTTKTLTIPRGSISVKARPYAEVFIDGQHVGTTPLTRPVYEGKHEVKLISSEGHGEQTRTVDVTADKEVSVAVKF